MSAPIEPPAPERLSTMNCCPNSCASFAVSTRAMMSVLPPGANGTATRTGLSGHFPACASACGAAARRASVNTILPALLVATMTSSLKLVSHRPTIHYPPPTASFRLDAGCRCDLSEFLDRCLLVGGERLDAGSHDVGRDVLLFLAEIGRLHDAHDLVVK